MVTRYKLPTPDGEFILVEARQAGQTVSDRQGRPVEVPTLLELKRLEAVEEAPSRRAAGWNPAQGGAFVLGTVLALLGGWAASHFYSQLPSRLAADEVWFRAAEQSLTAAATPDFAPPPEMQEFSDLDGAQIYRAWQSFRDFSLQEIPPAVAERVEQRRTYLTTRIIIATSVAVLGLLMIGGSFLLATPKRKAAP